MNQIPTISDSTSNAVFHYPKYDVNPYNMNPKMESKPFSEVIKDFNPMHLETYAKFAQGLNSIARLHNVNEFGSNVKLLENRGGLEMMLVVTFRSKVILRESYFMDYNLLPQSILGNALLLKSLSDMVVRAQTSILTAGLFSIIGPEIDKGDSI